MWQAVRPRRDDHSPARWGAACLAAALLTLGLASCGTALSPRPLPRTPTQAVASASPAVMAVTPGPQARFVPLVVTAAGVDQQGAPVKPTSRFAVGMPVYVVCWVQGVSSGQAHRLTIRWYLQAQLARMPGAYSYATVTQDGPLSFSVTYPSAGAGVAKLYWDEPVGDSNEQPSEHYLAQTIAFTVQ